MAAKLKAQLSTYFMKIWHIQADKWLHEWKKPSEWKIWSTCFFREKIKWTVVFSLIVLTGPGAAQTDATDKWQWNFLEEEKWKKGLGKEKIKLIERVVVVWDLHPLIKQDLI